MGNLSSSNQEQSRWVGGTLSDWEKVPGILLMVLMVGGTGTTLKLGGTERALPKRQGGGVLAPRLEPATQTKSLGGWHLGAALQESEWGGPELSPPLRSASVAAAHRAASGGSHLKRGGGSVDGPLAWTHLSRGRGAGLKNP